MADPKREDPIEDQIEDEEQEPPIETRFPTLPNAPTLPDAPRYEAKLPDISKPRPGAAAPGAYSKIAIAATAATSFIVPIIVLSVGGYFLDKKLNNTTPWFAMLGLIVGLAAGISALLKIIAKLQD
jgi:F0F1-type ATP synthase assembly protein I